MYLLVIVAFLSFLSPVNGQNSTEEADVEIEPICDSADLQVDIFQLAAFVHNYAESASISTNKYQDMIYLPKKVYDTVLYLLGAQKFSSSHYGVACTGTYPDLVFTILGRDLHIPQKYYVDQKVRDSNLCKVLLDYRADDQTYLFPSRFERNICRLL